MTPGKPKPRKLRKPRPKPPSKRLTAAQKTRHRAEVAKVKHAQELVAEVEAIHAAWQLYALRLNRLLGLKEGEQVNEDGQIVPVGDE